MSARSAMCPGCGAEIRFESVASLVVVCGACRYASYRRDISLELIGKVGEIARIESPIALRASGRLGGRAFQVVGLVQLDHGRGPWNEWSIEFSDGSRAWLAEAQGQYLVTTERKPRAVPDHAQLQVGSRLDLGEDGEWIVAERGSGRVVSLAGEIAVDLKPGQILRYADLGGPQGGFGTLDYGDGEQLRTVYLGRRCTWTELGIDAALSRPVEIARIRSSRVGCPSCAGAIEILDAANAKHVGCPYCGALIAREHEIWTVLEKSELFHSANGPSVGARGRYKDQEYMVLARLERSIRAEGQRWPWDEWLLRRADGEYRWLVCSDRHWSFVEPISLGDVKRRGSNLEHGGVLFKHFSGGLARVDRVVGELYWEVRLGDEVECADHVAPPRMLSVEKSADEKIISLAHYLQPDEVERMFGLSKPLRKPSGIGMIQPNPVLPHVGRFWKTGLLICALLLISAVIFNLLRDSGPLLSATTPLAAEGAFVSEPFELTGMRSRVQVGVVAPGMEKGHFRAEGQLVEQDSGAVHPFAIQTAGTPLSTAPSEVGGATVQVGSLPPGRYRMKLALHSSLDDPAGDVSISIVRKGGDVLHAFKLMLLILLLPLILLIVGGVLEGQRWQKSDHTG